MRRESDIQLSILHYLRRIGATGGKTKTMGVRRGKVFCFDPYTFRGFPDICGFFRNKIFFIEVKSETGTQSPEQKNFQNLCQEAGLTYILARDVETVDKVLNPQ